MGIKDWKIDNAWTLFLDRDGVINQRIFGGYILSFEDFHFENGALLALKKASSIFKRIIVVTNQQCVSLELINALELDSIHQAMVREIEDGGGRIDLILSALELKTDENNRRKPKSSMALEAKSVFHDIDFSKSIMIGDTDSDLLFGKKLGMKTVLVVSAEETFQEADMNVNSLKIFTDYL